MHGVSTRSVDDLVKALGADSGISKSEVSRICGELDEELTAFKERPLDHTVFPYVFLDATYCKARINHRIASQAVVIATGISATGHREILGLMVGDSESKPFWTKCWPNSTTSGRSSTAATCPKPPWPNSSPPSQPNPNHRSPHNRNRNSCRDYTTPRDMTSRGAAHTHRTLVAQASLGDQRSTRLTAYYSGASRGSPLPFWRSRHCCAVPPVQSAIVR